MERSLLWLHEQEVVRLNRGLTVFRPAMTIVLDRDPRGFKQSDHKSLALHYDATVRQIHVMAEFAQRGLANVADALQLSIDYFTLGEAEFLRRWLPDQHQELGRQTTPESWNKIVESLNNPRQRNLVADNRETTSVLVLAGPGSGKTRVLVHRIAYLIRARREDPRGILALAYNRHAAVEIRRRLRDLIGDDARGVMVFTCHALAMRLVGASFSGQADRETDTDLSERLRAILREATALLRGEGLDPEEAEESRARLLAGFRWILVDEYQDIAGDEYALISALAGRTLTEEDSRLSLFAVGDDDQNIYSFNGSSVEFIRSFEQGLQGQAGLPDRQLPLDPSHHRRRQRGDRPGTRPDEGRPCDPDQPGAPQDPRRWPVGRARSGRSRQGPGPADRRQQRHLAGSDRDGRAEAAVEPRPGLGLVDVRGDRPPMELPRTCANPLRARRDPSADGQRGEPEPVASARDPSALVNWVRGRDPGMIRSADLKDWLDRRPSGPWIDMLRQAEEEHSLEIRHGRCAGGIVHRVAGRVGPRRPAPPERATAVDSAPGQGAGVRPCGRTGRKLGPCQPKRGPRRPAPPLLRGHDQSPPHPRTLTPPRSTPVPGRAPGQPRQRNGAIP